MSTYATTLHLDVDTPEEQIDEIGRAVLIEQGRARRLTIIGEVRRISDDMVVAVANADGDPGMKYVPVGSAMARGMTTPEARMVTWEADTKVIETDPAIVVNGDPMDGKLSWSWLPETAQAGGMVTFHHGLTGDATIAVYDPAGNPLAYEYAVEISDGEHQVLVPTGARKIEARVDDPEETR